MSKTALIGKAKELYVATLLVAEHLNVYFPLVDTGFDLLVASKDGTKFLPVQVKYKSSRTGFTLNRSDAKKFETCNAVLAFGSEAADIDNFYFFPAKEWASKSEDRGRGDNKVVVYLTQHGKWADEFRGKAGLLRSFDSLLADA